MAHFNAAGDALHCYAVLALQGHLAVATHYELIESTHF